MMDLNQLYTVLFCLWFLALGAIEYLVLRWVWRRWFRSNAKPGRARLSGRDCGSFTVGARRQIEVRVKTRVKVCCESKPYFRHIVDPLIGVTQIAGGCSSFFREYSAPGSPLYCKTAVADAISNTRHGERYHQYAAVDAGCHQSTRR